MIATVMSSRRYYWYRFTWTTKSNWYE